MTHAAPPASETAPARPPAPASRRLSPGTLALQVVGGLIGLGLLGWCVYVALQPQNRAKLERLGDASPGQLAAMLGLSAVVVFCSGETFRRVLMPVKRLDLVGVQATNAIGSLLALLPFKLSVVFRVLVHNRRDGVPLLTIGAWFTAVAVVIMAVLAPVMLASAWRGRADVWWGVATVLGVVLFAGGAFAAARVLSAPGPWSRVTRTVERLPIPRRVLQSGLLDRVRDGLRMLSHPRSFAACVGVRVIDLAAQSARVFVAAMIVGKTMPWDQAVLAGSLYFFIGAVAIAGQLGAREGLTALLLVQLMPGVDLSEFAVIVLVVSASEMLVLLAASMVGMVIIRPDRLMAGQVRTGEPPAKV